MQAGRLRHRINIESQALQTADDYGQQAVAWSAIASGVAAEVSTLGGLEAWRAKQTQPEATVSVLIRYNSDVTSAVRFVFESRYLYPVSIVPDIKRREMVCMCKEQL